MKILIIAFEYPPLIGGGSTYNENVARSLAKQGVEVSVITGGQSDVTEKNDQITIHRFVAFAQATKGNLNIYEGVNNVINVVNQYHPDIIHTFHYLENLIAQIANVNFQLPLVTTPQRTPDPPGSRVSVNGKWSLYDFAFKNTSYIVNVSQFNQSRIFQSVQDINSSQSCVIYPGLDSSKYNYFRHTNEISHFRQKLGVSKEDILILAPMIVRPRKGLDFLCQAVCDYSNKSKRKIKLLITGTSLLEDKQIKLINDQLGKADLVLHDHFKSDKIPLVYKSSDLMILPSRSEGLGLVLIEANACGCPVIASDINGVNEVIKNNHNGILVEYDNFISLSNAIQQMIEQKSLREKFIKNGINSVQNKFNFEKQGSKLIKIYKNLLKQKNIIVSIPFIKQNGSISILTERQKNGKFALIKFKAEKRMALSESAFEKTDHILKLKEPQPVFTYKELADKNTTFYVYNYKLSGKINIDGKYNWIALKDAKKVVDKKESLILSRFGKLAGKFTFNV